MKQEWSTIQVRIIDNVALLQLNNPPVNQLSDGLRSDMRQAFREAFADDTIGAIIVSGTGKNFVAGADIKEIQYIQNKQAFLENVLEFDAFYNDIEDASKPVIAAINGHALGGGLELAMACHYRLATQGIKVGQPEILVGLIPGAGGTQRLPRLAGLSNAIEMITTGKQLSAEEALQLSVLDEVVPPEKLEDRAMEVAAMFADGREDHSLRRTRMRKDKLPSKEEKAAILSAAGEAVKKRAKGFSIPWKALEAMEKGLTDDFAADLHAEAELFVKCAVSPEAKNMIGIFVNTRNAGRLSRLEGVVPAKIEKVAMLGLGVMGSGIVHLLLNNGYKTILWEVDDSALEKGLMAVRKTFSYLLKKGKMSEDSLEYLIRENVKATTRIEDVAGADLVVEAIIEDMDVKKKMWSRIDQACEKNALFATNTSALPITELAKSIKNPKRMVGLHFFNPAERMQLVEVVSGRESSDASLSAAVNFTKKINKIPVVVNDGPGFYVSRQLNALMGECNFLLEEGYPMITVDRSLTEFGMPMGPLTLHDLTGIDIGYHVNRNFEKAFGKRWMLSELHRRIYETGCLGQKTGSGYYDYSDRKPVPNPKVVQVVEDFLREKGVKQKESSEVDIQQITDRMMARGINEAAYMMEEGICDRPWDMDLAMVYGCGFPAYRGGILRYADAWGMTNVLEALDALAIEHGERFLPCERIRRMAQNGETFYSK